MKGQRTPRQLWRENAELRKRLEEAEASLRAIRDLEVDALVVRTEHGKRVFTLHGAEHPYRVLIEEMNEGAVTLDSQGGVLYSNPRFADMVKAPLEQVVGVSIYRWVMPEDRAGLEALLKSANSITRRREVRLRCMDGSEIASNLSSSTLPGGEGPACFCLVATDLTDQNRARTALEAWHQQATHDCLTGVFNRSAILEILQRELARRKRDGSSPCLTIADVDHFKSVNDTYGHTVGDEVLREIIRRLQAQIRPYDSIGRYGGEEFLVVAPNCSSARARTLAERLRTCVANRPFQTDAGVIPITLSLGVVTCSGNLAVDTLFDLADGALYRAKHNGRNRVELTAGDDVGARRRFAAAGGMAQTSDF